MMGLKMNREQQLALYSKAFAFFVENEDKSRAEKVLESIEKMGDEGLAQVSRETFEIFLNHSDKYLDQMLARLDEAARASACACTSSSPSSMKTETTALLRMPITKRPSTRSTRCRNSA